MRVAAEVEVQSGGERGLAMRVAIEVEVQLGSGSGIEEAAEVVGVEGAAAEVEKPTLSTCFTTTCSNIESIGSVHITFHRL